MTPTTIWGEKQNNPELVVRDAAISFGLTDEQQDELRLILMRRGVNKWLLARRHFIRLKHRVKESLKAASPRTPEHRLLQSINTEMQNIAKMPRWVEWPRGVYRAAQGGKKCIVRGRRC